MKSPVFWILKGFETDMKTTVKFIGMLELFPEFNSQQEIQLDFEGDTVRDLLRHLLLKISPEKTRMLLNDQGEMSAGLLVFINGRPTLYSDQFSQCLHEGDYVELTLFSG